jgi:hypothetical protein
MQELPSTSCLFGNSNSFRATYQIIFIPNWICLDVVTVGGLTPAFAGTGWPWPLKMFTTWKPKFGLFNRLKNSARNCTLSFSLISWFLNNEKSKSFTASSRL